MQSHLTLKDAQTIQRVLNLTRHPMFTGMSCHSSEPCAQAWLEAVNALATLVQTIEIEGVASTHTR